MCKGRACEAREGTEADRLTYNLYADKKDVLSGTERQSEKGSERSAVGPDTVQPGVKVTV